MSKWVWILIALLAAGCAERGPQELTICCAGDSLMRPIPTHLRNLLPGRGSAIQVKEWARGGLSSQTYLSFYRKRVKRRNGYAINFILLQLGTNDASSLHSGEYSLTRFESNMKAILDEFRKFALERGDSVKILLASVPPLYAPEYQEINPFIEAELNPVIEKICEQDSVYFVDNWKMLCNRPYLYRPDGIHPNATGERILAQNWMIAIRRIVRSSTF